MNDETNLHPSRSEVKAVRFLRPTRRADALGACALCDENEMPDDGAFIEGADDGGRLCTSCAYKFVAGGMPRDAHDAVTGAWLEDIAATLRKRAALLDELRAAPPEVAPAAQWMMAHGRARVREVVAANGGCVRHLPEELLDRFASVLNDDDDVDDVPF